MYCIYCGKELPDEAKFCMECGASMLKNSVNKQEHISTTTPKLTQTFNFKREKNQESIRSINRWLNNKNILITSMSIVSTLWMPVINPLGAETVISRCEIIYQKVDNPLYFYQMGVFSTQKAMRPDYETLDKNLDNWNKKHPESEVVYSTHAGHMINNIHTTSLYFLYRIAADAHVGF